MSTPAQLGEPLPACFPSEETLELLAKRRSTAVAMLTEPGPDQLEIERLIALSARVPDHRRVAPYRFLTFTDESRAAIGNILAEIFRRNQPEASGEQVETERQRFCRSPLVIGVISSPDSEHKTPVWEQQLTVGAACQNMMIAASAMGFAAQWLTEWYAFDPAALEAFGVKPDEQVAGFIYIGTACEAPLERPRVDPQTLTTAWKAPV